MVFTSESGINRHNKFHIGSRGQAKLLIGLQEYIEFNVLQEASMLIPTITGKAKEKMNGLIPTNIECISGERVISSCYKEDNFTKKIKLAGNPKKIISCSVNDVKIEKKVLSCTNGDKYYLLLIYSYDVSIVYIDKKGSRQKMKHRIQSRYQWTYLKDKVGYLDIKLKIYCYKSKIMRNNTSSISKGRKVEKKGVNFIPANIWLRIKN